VPVVSQISLWGRNLPSTVYAYYSFSGNCAKSVLQNWYDQVFDLEAEDQYELFENNEMRLRMCPPRVLGYALNARMWAQFGVRSILPDSLKTDEQRQFFEHQLQLNQEYKQLLMAFVKNYETAYGRRRSHAAGPNGSAPNSLDVIDGKGNGLVVLLHGPPGVGKTLTAEAIALATGRPLLAVSAEEIGTTVSKAEARLTALLTSAARWRAVLLLDEADVFLEDRSSFSGRSSNSALFFVLLRCLEYYEGIVFLTTNRITSIDIGVQSRMHLAIQYKDLTEVQKFEIFKNFLEKVPDSKIVGSRRDLYKRVEGLCVRNILNGRQIRNIVSAALALAKSDEQGSGKLSYEHLRRVFETTMDFLDCLKDLTKQKRAALEAP
jgi:SpoVK/Ycf46/Vps4 family AAA+-type ATPase